MSALACWLLGEPSLLPFSGHFRLDVVGKRAAVAVAGRVAGDAGPVRSFDHARQVASVLGTAADGPWAETDRHGLVRRIWQLLDSLDGKALGPTRGGDLSLLLLARDERGSGVAGVGLSGVWVHMDGWRALVPPGHPLLAPTGRPSHLPGVLTLEQPSTWVVGAPAHLDPILPAAEILARRCGVRSPGAHA